ncbi:MAG TPA: hypothetical protein VKY73_17660 [Polyangiaceae bacterium]|nr:hypothetical protein [Polyangiaceae bacterium]
MQYLARYAEPEAGLAARVATRYFATLVVPALAESPALLDGVRAAARAATGRVLVIVVVNARASSPSEVRAENARLLAAFAELGPREALAPGAFVVADPDFDLVVVDRTSAGRELPERQGVGLARKIGADFALALHARGLLEVPLLFFSDADAVLPSGYFGAGAAAGDGVSALLFPFRHEGCGDDAAARATELYEASLRYHVLGLASAGSPYAYHSIGSTLAVEASAYALVRGVPKRSAGEDFYLLAKLAKVAPVRRLGGEPVRIRARFSARVPFGTGPAVARIAASGRVSVAAPAAFVALRAVVGGLSAAAREQRVAVLEAGLVDLDAVAGAAVRRALAALGIEEACRSALRESGGVNLERRLHTWFDALRTLRALHVFRDAGLPDCDLAEALERADFAAGARGASPGEAAERLSRLEAALPACIGPTLLGGVPRACNPRPS